MPAWPVVNGRGDGIAFTAGTTRYVGIGGSLTLSATAETTVQCTARDTYTFANLYVRVLSNGPTGGTTVVKSRKNTADGALTIGNITGLGTGVFQDTVNSDSLVDGDLFNHIVQVGTGGSLQLSVIGCTLNGNSMIMGVQTAAVGFAANSNGYITGEARVGTTENDKKYVVRSSQTFSNMQIILSANTRSQVVDVTFRKNGLNGNQTVQFPASTAGMLEDTVNSDPVVSGDTVNYQYIFTAGTGTLTLGNVYVKSTLAGKYLIAGGNLATATTIAAGTTANFVIEGNAYQYAVSGSEANAQIAVQVACKAKNMFVRVRNNTLDAGNTTIYLRQNGANATLNSGNIPFTGTGTYEDTVNTDTLAAADLINWQMIVSGATGAIALDYIGCELVGARRRTRMFS